MAPPACLAARDVSATTAERVLPACEWTARAASHRARAERWIVPARDRRAANKPHPVDDFLFTYYRFSYAKIEEWHPPVGTALELTDLLPAHLSKEPYRIEDGRVIADPSLLGEKDRARLRWMRELLVATRDRPPVFSCHGLHEWAMVYRGDEVRHAGTTPLRLPQAEVDALVESRPVRCSHFDAFRFFHPDARPLNRLQPTLHGRPDFVGEPVGQGEGDQYLVVADERNHPQAVLGRDGPPGSQHDHDEHGREDERTDWSAGL